jgi:hypothetical protein
LGERSETLLAEIENGLWRLLGLLLEEVEHHDDITLRLGFGPAYVEQVRHPELDPASGVEAEVVVKGPRAAMSLDPFAHKLCWLSESHLVLATIHGEMPMASPFTQKRF